MVFLLTENRKQTRVMKYMTNQPKQCTILQGTSLKTGPQTLGTKFDSSQNPSRSKTPAKPLGVFFRRKWMQQANKEGTQTKKKLYQVLQMFFKIISFGRTRNLHLGNQVGSLWRSWWHESGNRLLLGYFPFPRPQIFWKGSMLGEIVTLAHVVAYFGTWILTSKCSSSFEMNKIQGPFLRDA